MTDEFLDQHTLAKRWTLSERTLERWRWVKQGPSYFKLGRRVVYRLEHILAFEAKGLHVVVQPDAGSESPQVVEHLGPDVADQQGTP